MREYDPETIKDLQEKSKPDPKRPRIYVMGPLTSSGYWPENIRLACQYGSWIWSIGGSPFIPHINAVWAMIDDKKIPDVEYLAWDRGWLSTCHAAFRIPGYSTGAEVERLDCVDGLKIPVFTNEGELSQWIAEYRRAFEYERRDV